MTMRAAETAVISTDLLTRRRPASRPDATRRNQSKCGTALSPRSLGQTLITSRIGNVYDTVPRAGGMGAAKPPLTIPGPTWLLGERVPGGPLRQANTGALCHRLYPSPVCPNHIFLCMRQQPPGPHCPCRQPAPVTRRSCACPGILLLPPPAPGVPDATGAPPPHRVAASAPGPRRCPRHPRHPSGAIPAIHGSRDRPSLPSYYRRAIEWRCNGHVFLSAALPPIIDAAGFCREGDQRCLWRVWRGHDSAGPAALRAGRGRGPAGGGPAARRPGGDDRDTGYDSPRAG